MESYYNQSLVTDNHRQDLTGNILDQQMLPGENSMFMDENGEIRTLNSSQCKGLTSFHCDICGKGYKYKRSLDLHMKKHRGIYFDCPLCEVKFSEKGSLKRHLKRKHNHTFCPKCSQLVPLDSLSSHVLSCTE